MCDCVCVREREGERGEGETLRWFEIGKNDFFIFVIIFFRTFLNVSRVTFFSTSVVLNLFCSVGPSTSKKYSTDPQSVNIGITCGPLTPCKRGLKWYNTLLL